MGQIESKYTDPLRRDALEAFHLTRSIRNALFFLLLVSLLILGGAFWITDIVHRQKLLSHSDVISCEPVEMPAPDITLKETPAPVVAENTSIPVVPDEANTDAETAPSRESVDILAEADGPGNENAAHNNQWCEQLARVLATAGRFGAFFSGMVYLLTLLLMMKLTIVGRLGGVAPLTRAFFLMLLAGVLMVPWRSLALIHFPGALFLYDEMLDVQRGLVTAGDAFCYYLHYVGLWVGVLLLVIAAQWRSRQGVKMVKRLQVPPAPLTPTLVFARPEPVSTAEPIPLEPLNNQIETSAPSDDNPS